MDARLILKVESLVLSDGFDRVRGPYDAGGGNGIKETQT